jgi:hypothetical protein
MLMGYIKLGGGSSQGAQRIWPIRATGAIDGAQFPYETFRLLVYLPYFSNFRCHQIVLSITAKYI